MRPQHTAHRLSTAALFAFAAALTLALSSSIASARIHPHAHEHAQAKTFASAHHDGRAAAAACAGDVCTYAAADSSLHGAALHEAETNALSARDAHHRVEAHEEPHNGHQHSHYQQQHSQYQQQHSQYQQQYQHQQQHSQYQQQNQYQQQQQQHGHSRQGTPSSRRDLPQDESRDLDGKRENSHRDYTRASHSSYSSSSSSSSSSSTFVIKPNTPGQSDPLQVGQSVCMFRFLAFGGTNENWEISAVQLNDYYKCTISRPQGHSYLYFQSFTATFKGLSRFSRVELWDDNGVALEGDTYTVTGSEVSSTSSWDGPVHKIVIEGYA